MSEGSRWVKCISTHGNIRGAAIDATELIQEMVDRHKMTSSQAIQGLGEAVMSALLIASHCKQNQHINLNIQASGLYKQALVDANPDGTVRGYIVERTPATEPTHGSTGEKDDALTLEFQPNLNLNQNSGPWGNGLLSVLKTQSHQEEKPYISTVPLITGHLAKDMSFYWVQSEQIPTAVGLAVNLEGSRVNAAAAFLIQALPGASSSEVQSIEQHITEIGSFPDRISLGFTPVHILSQIFQSTPFILLEERDLKFNCGCSWERVRKALILIGSTELQAMLEQDQGAIIHCDFCSKEYRVDSKELIRLIDQAGGKE